MIWILTALAIIELAIVFKLSQNENPILLFVRKCVKFSFFYWLVINWTSGMNLIKQTFDMIRNF